jgi:hypothetical protein
VCRAVGRCDDDQLRWRAAICGFGIPGDIDLADIGHKSATTSLLFTEAGSTLSGTLTVSDGSGHVAALTLLG